MLSRISGSLVAAVVGDCIGAVFEGVYRAPPVKSVLKEVAKIEQSVELKKLRTADSKTKPKQYIFTDDTAMARSIVASLVEKKAFDVKNIAARFGEEYKKEPDRGYGSNVVTVLVELADPKLEDIFRPAREQFNGSGSYGNGGAMRIAPLGLFYYKSDFSELQRMSREVTALTHTHPQGILGAILLCRAVQLALSADNTQPLDANDFLDTLLEDLGTLEKETASQLAKKIEGSADAEDISKAQNHLPYCEKLEIIKDFLTCDVETEEVEAKLGNGIAALESVPTAVYCFLRASQKSCPGFKDRNEVEQSILYAISLGGDTDTIATMAAAMAGAFFGVEMVPETWQAACEGVDDAKQFAEKMVAILEGS